MSKLKILHVAETIWGGCGTYLNELMPLQSAHLGAAQVRCLVPAQHRPQLHDVPAAQVATFDRRSRKAGIAKLAAAVLQQVRDWQPDLLHVHSTVAGGIVRLLSCVRPLPPIVYCPHGWVFDVARGPASRTLAHLAERLLAPRSRRIVAISEAERLAGVRAGIHASRLVLVSNGIAARCPAVTAHWNDARLKVLFVGRLDRQKGADLLLQAVQNLGEQVSVRIVGEEVVSGAQGLAALNRQPHVAFLGWQDKLGVAAQMNACDLVVMPSRWEGFGLVAVEAMRAGKPVLAADVGGLPEIVVPGLTGWLVPPDDALALQTALLAADADTRHRLGQAGRLRFHERFTSQRMHEQLLQVYVDALGSSARPAMVAPAEVPAPSPQRVG